MWLQALRLWLEKQKHLAQEQQVDELARRQLDELELRKAEQAIWFVPPPG